ncbi:unnamed protein product [Protopolystoma xenopodis]|uniref:FZ domain-containing protein n=1 Tax=Protopolystoma xenopodis TaxID=117903 RepID=A0A448XMB3_9PLAT|nr:unnamed protein product [Protopolystoma xenopodis]
MGPRGTVGTVALLFCASWICSCVASTLHDRVHGPVKVYRCENPLTIVIDECKNSFYSFTGMPNLVGQESQDDARHQMQMFDPLINYRCSEKLRFFLCSVHTPMCDANTLHLIGPCRPLCQHVYERCFPVMKTFNLPWPESLNCSRFPMKNSDNGVMCMDGPRNTEEDARPVQRPPAVEGREEAGHESGATSLSSSSLSVSADATSELRSSLQKWLRKVTKLPPDARPVFLSGEADQPPNALAQLAKSLRHCGHLRQPLSYVFINRTGRCAPLCRADLLFSRPTKRLAATWTLVLAIVGLVAGVFSLTNYCLGIRFFSTRERPVVYLAGCQLAEATALLLATGLGRDMVTCAREPTSGRDIRLQEGLDNSVCALTFLVQYFFTTAAWIWWLLLAVAFGVSSSMRHVGRLRVRDRPQTVRWASIPASHVARRAEGVDEASSKRGACAWICCPPSSRPDAGSCCFCHWPCSMDEPMEPREPHFYRPGPLAAMTSSISVSVGGANKAFYQIGGVLVRQIYPREDTGFACLARQHVIAWLTAGLLTVSVLVSRQVGNCFL